MKDKIVKLVTDYYLSSSDFNGKQIRSLLEELGLEWKDIKKTLQELVRDEQIRLIDEDSDINPNIIRIGFNSIEFQLSSLDVDTPKPLCFYPTPQILKDAIILDDYKTAPYTLKLALGDAQLSFSVFDLSVLETYRNDPRYHYETDDIQGQIFCENESILDADRIFLETFGFAYDKDFNRAIAVFTRYLANLTREHQQIWKFKEISGGGYSLHPDYHRISICGEWGERESIFQALLEELDIVNQMCKAMGRPVLFRDDYKQNAEKRLKKFHFLIRPTLNEFNDFILLLDKMLSDNINKEFFMDDIKYEKEMPRNDGKIIVSQKGTLTLLDEWFRSQMFLLDWSDWDNAIFALKKVRKLRQQPAHSIKEDVYDQKYFKEQRKVIIDAYFAIKMIRLLFANHPRVNAAQIEVPDWLYNGQIWTK